MSWYFFVKFYAILITDIDTHSTAGLTVPGAAQGAGLGELCMATKLVAHMGVSGG